MEKIAEQFILKYPAIKVNVQGGGSSAGIQATFNGTCDIGMSSRNLEADETQLKTVLIAYDGIAIIVHKDNPTENLTTEQIRKIFAGKITDWQGLNGIDKKIISVTREEGSGTRAAFVELVMHGKLISDACLVQDSNGAIREIVATTPEAIGYISAGLIDERIKAVAIDSIYPKLENFVTHRYRFVRPFLLMTKAEPKGNVRRFIDYVLSEDAQKSLKEAGLIPAQEIKQ